MVQAERGLDFNGAVQELARELNVPIEMDTPSERKRVKKPAQTEPVTVSADYSEYYQHCRERLTDPRAIEYLTGRGISLATAQKYGLGFDPAADPANAPGAGDDEPKRHPTPRIIIPTTSSHYIGRLMEPNTPGNKDYRKMNSKGSKPGLFNGSALWDSPVVFIVEGAFDALSILEVGQAATAINSVSNVNSLLSELNAKKTTATIIVSLDADNSGETASGKLCDGLSQLGIPYVVGSINCGFKDANEALTQDREAFVRAVKEEVRRAKEAVPNVAVLVKAGLEKTTKGEIKSTINNFVTILKHDPHFSSVRYNILSGRPENVSGNVREQWSNAKDSEIRAYVEARYGILNASKLDDAFRIFLQERAYNPVLEEIQKTAWDGKPRCERFFIEHLGAADTPYTRECARLLFAGGINRIVSPGSKFDCVIVLIGAQGSGKSTICSWLALHDDFYTSCKTIAGKEGYEAIEGKWLVELEELLAVLANEKGGQKVEETAKAFLSTRSDYYRKSYDRRPEDNPRCCIFIGTTNRDTFLTDKTGNRRWYPVRCSFRAGDIYDHEAEIKAEIRQAWAEMLSAYRQNDPFSLPSPRTELLSAIVEQQADAAVEDPRIGMIAEYIADKERVCLKGVWDDCLHADCISKPQPTKRDLNDLSEILVNQLGCVRGPVARFGNKIGRQRSFIPPGSPSFTAELPF